MKPVPPVTSSLIRSAPPARRRSARWRGRRRRDSRRWPSARTPRATSAARSPAATMRSRSVPTTTAVPAVHALGPLGHLAQHQHRLAQRRRLLLHPAAVGQHQVGARHQVHELHVVHRRDQVHPGQVAQQRLDRPLDLGVRVDRQHELELGKPARPARGWRAQVERSGAPKLSRRWVVTSTTRRCRVERGERRRPEAVVGADRLQQRVDDGVAGEVDVPGRDPLGEQRVARGRGVGAKCSAAIRVVSTRFISSGNGCQRSPVRRPGLDVPGRNPLEERRQAPRRRSSWCRPAPGSRRAAPGGAAAAAGRGCPRRCPAGVCPGTIRSRSTSALRSKTSSTWSSMRPMLGRHADQALEAVGRGSERAHDRRHLDRLRPGAEDAEDADHRAEAAACSRSASVCMVTNRKPRSTTRAKTLRSTASRTPS